MSKNLYVDFHVIQTVPPSCVNRDDTGSPKTAIYGGTRRARVSSQAWKRAMRRMFEESFASGFSGYRTRKTKELVAEKICGIRSDIDRETAEKMAEEILNFAGVKGDSAKKDVLFFASTGQIDRIAELAVEYREDPQDKKEKEKTYKIRAAKALIENPSVDILLFGRMAAGNPSLNYDAAAQVAHSISTHAVSNEYDYFTAVDDCEPMGAGHIGMVEFNSATLYRYATVNVRELAGNLKQEELKQAVRGFAEAFICAMPGGKQNSFANRTIPDLVYVTLREDQPINLAGAFEKPVPARGEGYVSESKRALADYAGNVYGYFAALPKQAWVSGEVPGEMGENVNVKDLLEKLEEEIGKYCAEKE